jgi:phosphoribosylanthranilate isomerase
MQIKAARIAKKSDLKGLKPFAGCAGFLLDAAAPAGAFGGTGKSFPWILALEAKKMYPAKPLILAGGLNPGNVAQAVKQVQPWAVDVASGVESAPGKKDIKKVKAFIEAAKGRSYGEEKN